ncbi:LOW QUALITY PROTEIN: Ribosomal_L6e domain-containing protein [Cephalotus follicularis]|uniref:Ribosomal_L6e domain-containing protein n=1 Tax=Cephalotus follicularis TaxID=3775 RepID=A0A1Q3B7B5_CEPFO|nr:LOW QUALITY PROTEIN: Ribosomal_L6e domain-containing protein [Cephalotus follicularis]
MYHKGGFWKNGAVFSRHDPTPVAGKARKFYPADDVNRSQVCFLSITPVTVLILLAGRFWGERVVFLKQLPSGLLLVTGPFKVNGVPLRWVNQSYAIATSTKVDISGVDVEKFDDQYFTKEAEKKKKGEGEFFEAEKKVLPEEKKDDQKAVDAPLIKAIEEVAEFKVYLAARFSLQSGMKTQELAFWRNGLSYHHVSLPRSHFLLVLLLLLLIVNDLIAQIL